MEKCINSQDGIIKIYKRVMLMLALGQKERQIFALFGKLIRILPKNAGRHFLNAKIFDGKTIEEAGDDVEFLYWG